MLVFRNEDEFKAHVQRALQSDGHTTRREVPVRTRHRLDFVAIKDGVKKGIEAKSIIAVSSMTSPTMVFQQLSTILIRLFDLTASTAIADIARAYPKCQPDAWVR